MSPDLYQTLARYSHWMNEKAGDACARLTDAERKEDRGAFFGSVHGALNHLLYGDRAWMNRLAGRSYERPPVGEEIYADFDALRAAQREIDADILDWTSKLTPDWLKGSTAWVSGVDGSERTQPNWFLTSHLFNHQTHHRGQLTTLLTQLGQDVGVTDLPWMPDAPSA